MIDWISGFWRIVDAEGKIVDPANVEGLRGNLVLTLDPSSEEVRSEAFSRRRIGPSEDCSSLSIQTKVVAGELYISGNPLSFIQGHNLFSTLEPWEAVQKWENDLLRRAKIPDHRMELVRLTRIDLTQEIDCETREASLATLNALKTGWTAPKCRKTIEDHSVYLGKGSTRWTLKAYRKNLSPAKSLQPASQADISSFLRLELCLRAPGMKAEGLDPSKPREWDLFEVFRTFLERCRLSLGNQTHSAESIPQSLSSVMRGHWASWRNGARLREELKPSTFYRVKKEFLAIGVDIDSPPTEAAVDRIRSLSWEELSDSSRWHGTRFIAASIEASRRARSSRGITHED